MDCSLGKGDSFRADGDGKEELLDVVKKLCNKEASHREDFVKGPSLIERMENSGEVVARFVKEKRIGHRRVDSTGEVTYKKIDTCQIIGSVQLGIRHAIDQLAQKADRDLLMQDFMTVEITKFISRGSVETPAHRYPEFTFKTYAPTAFRYFRDLFGIKSDDFLESFCSEPLSQLSNPGASGSVFYLTHDDEFIVKTIQHKEGEFLQTLLPGYYMNLNQNPATLLPKFFGLYCYKYNLKRIRLVVMNNLLPSSVATHQKYDLKGSTYKRKASATEKQKDCPTYKDLDFLEHHPEGLFLKSETYNALVGTLERDCRVLESFKIIDYSLLIGIYKRKAIMEMQTGKEDQKSMGKAIFQDKSYSMGGIPAKNGRGEELMVFIGIIDILQSYRLKKRLEHAWKSVLQDRDSVSVHNPHFYSHRFQDFIIGKVFRKTPSPRKQSPAKQKTCKTTVDHCNQQMVKSHEDLHETNDPFEERTTPCLINARNVETTIAKEGTSQL